MAKRSTRALWTAAVRNGKISRPPPTRTLSTPAGRRGFRGIILGVDPSLRGTGLAVIDLSGTAPRLLASSTLHMPVSQPAHVCLARIYREVLAYARQYQVGAVALESTIYVQNLKTVAILGASRGAALAAAGELNVAVAEYAPTRIKLAIVGKGQATKSQVIGMVSQLLGLKVPLAHDQADAAAIALCHGWTARD